MPVQSVLVPKIFPLDYAINWIKTHDYDVKKVDITEQFYRFRQEEPNKKFKYYTIKLPNGVRLVSYKN